MSGGIIIQRRAVLVPVAKDPCIYDSLNVQDKAKVDAIANKDPGSTTQEDLQELVRAIRIAVHNG